MGGIAKHARHESVYLRRRACDQALYVSSAAYIDRMSYCCKGCAYDLKQRVCDSACPFNAMYWAFYHRNVDKLKSNPRSNMVSRHLEGMEADTLDALHAHAVQLRQWLDAL